MKKRIKKVAAAARARKRKRLGKVSPPKTVGRETGFPEEKAAYYDEHVPKDLNLDSYWMKLYGRAISYLEPPTTPTAIVDLGCGPGFFAEVLRDKGYTHYLGLDLSETCIQQAKARVPEFEFAVADLYDSETQEKFAEYDVFICLQTLEHLEHDLEVIRAIPSGKQVVLSVPNTSGQGHVRVFGGKGEVERRYGDLINFKNMSSIYRGRGEVYFFVGNGVRK